MNSFPVLTGLGLEPGKPELYQNLLLKLQEDTWGPELVTCKFVLELRDQVELQDSLRTGVPGQKITTRQFAHVLAMMGDPNKYPTEEMIKKDLKKKLWSVRDLETLSKKVKNGSMDGAASWPLFDRVFPGAAAGFLKSVALPPALEEAPGDESATHRFLTLYLAFLFPSPRSPLKRSAPKPGLEKL